MSGKLLGRLANRGSRSCDCCHHGKSKRQWKRDERQQWRRETEEEDVT